MTHYYHHEAPFALESGERLDRLTIAYHTYGRMDETKSNVVWVCHALTANSDVAEWWPHTVETGGFLDPDKWYVVCANIIGSHYGTTGPLSENPATGEPYYGDFPSVTIRDITKAHMLLARHLGIGHIHALIGSSVGGFQALEWIAEEPLRFSRLILIATDALATPWTIAADETQRMAIRADSTFGERNPQAGMDGLAAARAIGMLTYRGGSGYNASQQESDSHDPARSEHRVCSYQRYQGAKLCRRFNAYSYMSILDSFDTHDIGRGRGGVAAALAAVRTDAIVIGITSDIIFPPSEMKCLCAMIPGAIYAEIESQFGHDGFLVEHAQLNKIVRPFIEKTTDRNFTQYE